MKRDILYTIFFLLPVISYGQTVQMGNLLRAPSMQKTGNSTASLNVTIPMNQFMEFTVENDINAGKNYPGFYKVTVTSDVPWVVNIMAKTSFFTPSSPEASNNMPASIMSLKENTGSNFITLSETPQNLLISNHSSFNSIFYLDLKIDPSWNYKGGNYYQQIIFTLSAQ